MLSARLCQVAWANPYIKSVPVVRSIIFSPGNLKRPIIRNNNIRQFFDNSKDRISHAARRKTLTERAMAPAGDSAFSLGKGAVAGGAAVGLCALCYYGLGMSSEAGAFEKAQFWPQYVKDRIRSTYMYFGGSIAISVASAAAVLQNRRLIQLVAGGGITSMLITMAALIGSSIVLQSIPYSPGFGVKQLAWIGHSALLGAVLAPMAFVGGPVLLKAAWYTAGIVGGLSTVAVCAPSEKFLSMGGPLAIGLGVVFASSIGTFFLPPTTALGSGFYAVSIYGGLLLFSGFLLFNTQRTIRAAEKHPPEYAGVRPFDPINQSLSIYIDTVNIFIRMVHILAGGGNKKR